MTDSRLLIPPRVVFFDLDDTLISAYRNPVATWTAIIAEHAEALGEQDASWVTQGVIGRVLDFLRDDEGRRLWRLEADATRRKVIRQAFHRLNLVRPPGSEPLHGVDADRIADRFETYLHEVMTLKPGALEMLGALHAAGLRLALLTNGSSRTQRHKIAQFGLAPYFDAIRIEEEVGAGKADPAAWHAALAALGVGADEAWMVGDEPMWDIGVPRRLGLGTVLFDDLGGRVPDPEGPPHATLTRLADLPPLVQAATRRLDARG